MCETPVRSRVSSSGKGSEDEMTGLDLYGMCGARAVEECRGEDKNECP